MTVNDCLSFFAVASTSLGPDMVLRWREVLDEYVGNYDCSDKQHQALAELIQQCRGLNVDSRTGKKLIIAAEKARQELHPVPGSRSYMSAGDQLSSSSDH